MFLIILLILKIFDQLKPSFYLKQCFYNNFHDVFYVKIKKNQRLIIENCSYLKVECW
jgi:hypothetical protein